ncbi:MAG: hypothetical protein AAGF24_03500 [Cyanobacteria bacterium P01_H01_bin.121]
MANFITYDQHYALADVLDQAAAGLLPSPTLYDYRTAEVYAAALDRLAQDLPDGTPSPFSSRSPGLVHTMLLSVLLHQFEIIGHEINLTPDQVWIELYRLLGVELQPAEPPIINLRFTRTADAIANNFPVSIPLGTEVRSRFNPNLSVYTTRTVTIDGNQHEATIPARFKFLGKLPPIRTREFTDIARNLSYVEAFNDGTIVNEGREAETLPEAMLRARLGIQTGTLGKDTLPPTATEFMGRCITMRDYDFWARRFGAEKVNVLPGIQYGAQGSYGDLVTLAVYPTEVRDFVFENLQAMIPLGQRFDVVPAELIPVNGTITIRTIPTLSANEKFNLAAGAIASQINPPHGKWADQQFNNSLATVLELVEGFYAVPSIQLKHSQTEQPLEEIELRPWHLIEVQSSVSLNFQL